MYCFEILAQLVKGPRDRGYMSKECFFEVRTYAPVYEV